MKIFFDTSSFIALQIPSDSKHQQVLDKYQEYKKERARFFTSDYILDELYTRLVYDFGKEITSRTIKIINQAVERHEMTVFRIDEAISKKAQNVIIKYAEHRISFTDATTFILYRNFLLDKIFTLEGGFKKMRAATSF